MKITLPGVNALNSAAESVGINKKTHHQNSNYSASVNVQMQHSISVDQSTQDIDLQKVAYFRDLIAHNHFIINHQQIADALLSDIH